MMCVVPRTNLLEFDEKLPNRDAMLDAHLMKKRIEETLSLNIARCEIVRAKYQINSSLRVLYKVVADQKEMLVSSRNYAKNPTEIDFYIFPNDRKIKGLDVLESPPKSFPNFWKESCVVAYAPEKCVTAECLNANNEIFAYAKIYAENEFKTGEKVFQFLTEQVNKTSSNLFPKVLGFDETEKILMLKNVEGERLANLAKLQNQRGFYLLGRAIAQLHETATEVDLPEFSRLSPERIKFALQTISLARPDCHSQAEKLARKLLENYAYSDEEKTVLHGDVHPKNGVLQDAETVALIDFDQLSQGNPAAEIGSFLAGLFYKEIVGFDSKAECQQFSEAFLQGYSEIRNLPSQNSLNWHTATALLTERALRSISRVRVEGLQKISEILTVSEIVLVGGEK